MNERMKFLWFCIKRMTLLLFLFISILYVALRIEALTKYTDINGFSNMNILSMGVYLTVLAFLMIVVIMLTIFTIGFVYDWFNDEY